MPPNAKGGKGYKKKKKVSNEVIPGMNFLEKQSDQMVARAIRLLGNRNVLCYCNDNILRICHICGRMKGRAWVEPGDLVLVSLRELSTIETEKKTALRGDIVGKYVPDQFSTLRKERGMNQKLFMKLESMDGVVLEEIGVDKSNDIRLKEADDCGFTFEDGDGDGGSEDESSSEEDEEAAAALEALKRRARKGAAGSGPTYVQSGAEIAKEMRAMMDLDDVDIDAI